jgi:rhamnosyl/mannosyltransferase
VGVGELLPDMEVNQPTDATPGRRRLRVFHVYRTYFPDTQGGLEEAIRQICASTASHGVTSRVLAVSREPDRRVVRLAEAPVYRARQSFEIASCNVSLDAFALYRRLANWADVIHYHFPWPMADVLHLTSTHGKPTLLTYHSDIVRQRVLGWLYRPLMRHFLKSVDKIVCTSPNYFATSDVLSRFESKVEVIPIGLDGGTYPLVEDLEIADVEREFGSNFFLFVGVLRYYKGLHILLDAVANAPYNVVIVGSGPTERSLRQQVERLGLSNVRITGYLPDRTKVALFRLSRAIVFPSYLRSEAFGVTLLEGAMYGKPLISTEVGSGTSHVNVDRETGFVITPGSPKALRHAMDQLHYRPEMAELMGRRARERFERLFSGRLMGQRYHDVYRRLVSSDTAQGQSRETEPGSAAAP